MKLWRISMGVILCVLVNQSHALTTYLNDEFQPYQLAQNTVKSTSGDSSVLDQRVRAIEHDMAKDSTGDYAFQLYEPNYLLPFFYEDKVAPYYANHPGTTPDDQAIKHEELKAQLSVLMPIWQNMFNSKFTLNIAYTQVMFWQVYANSPYFREINYEPRLFASRMLSKYVLFSVGLDHQSNGRGGDTINGMERSWNRVFADVFYSRGRWLVGVEPWVAIFKSASQDKHNPDIERFLGYGRELFVYKFKNDQEVSVMLRNVFESAFSRGAVQMSYAYPIHGTISIYGQVFFGYGQSLIEYNHYTDAIGIGISFSNWV